MNYATAECLIPDCCRPNLSCHYLQNWYFNDSSKFSVFKNKILTTNKERKREKTKSNTNPSSLTIHMYGANVICQIWAGAEASMAVVPTTVISNAFCRGGRNSLSIHHNRSGTPTGNCAVYVHNSAAYAVKTKKKKKRNSVLVAC